MTENVVPPVSDGKVDSKITSGEETGQAIGQAGVPPIAEAGDVSDGDSNPDPEELTKWLELLNQFEKQPAELDWVLNAAPEKVDAKKLQEGILGDAFASPCIWQVEDMLQSQDYMGEMACLQIRHWLLEHNVTEESVYRWDQSQHDNFKALIAVLNDLGKHDLKPRVILLDMGQRSGEIWTNDAVSELDATLQRLECHLFAISPKIFLSSERIAVWRPNFIRLHLRSLIYEIGQSKEEELRNAVEDFLADRKDFFVELQQDNDLTQFFADLRRDLISARDQSGARRMDAKEFKLRLEKARKTYSEKDQAFESEILNQVFASGHDTSPDGPKVPRLSHRGGVMEPYGSVLFAACAFHEANKGFDVELEVFNTFLSRMMLGETALVEPPLIKAENAEYVDRDLYDVYLENAAAIRARLGLEIRFSDSNSAKLGFSGPRMLRAAREVLNRQVVEYRNSRRKEVLKTRIPLDSQEILRHVALNILRSDLPGFATEAERTQSANRMIAVYRLEYLDHLYEPEGFKRAVQAIVDWFTADLREAPDNPKILKEYKQFVSRLISRLFEADRPITAVKLAVHMLKSTPKLVDVDRLVENHLSKNLEAAGLFLDEVERIVVSAGFTDIKTQLFESAYKYMGQSNANDGGEFPDLWAALSLRLVARTVEKLTWDDFRPRGAGIFSNPFAQQIFGQSGEVARVAEILTSERLEAYMVWLAARHANAKVQIWAAYEGRTYFNIAVLCAYKAPRIAAPTGGKPGRNPLTPPLGDMEARFRPDEAEGALPPSEGADAGEEAASTATDAKDEAEKANNARRRLSFHEALVWGKVVLDAEGVRYIASMFPLLILFEIAIMGRLSKRKFVVQEVQKRLKVQYKAATPAMRKKISRSLNECRKAVRSVVVDRRKDAAEAQRKKLIDAAMLREFNAYLTERSDSDLQIG